MSATNLLPINVYNYKCLLGDFFICDITTLVNVLFLLFTQMPGLQLSIYEKIYVTNIKECLMLNPSSSDHSS